MIPGSRTSAFLWLAGTVTPLARSNLERLGFRVTENVDQRIGFVD